MGTTRKPSGFWSKNEGRQLVEMFVTGEFTLDETVIAVREVCEEQGVDAAYLTDSILQEDVKWYAREVRKALRLPSLKEVAAQVKAQTEIAEVAAE